MESDLEGGEPVMWKKKEYKFIQYAVGKGPEIMARIQPCKGKVKTVPAGELDLVWVLNFDCGDDNE